MDRVRAAGSVILGIGKWEPYLVVAWMDPAVYRRSRLARTEVELERT